MNKILVTFKKNKNNKYDFKVEQNEVTLYNKEYTADKKYTDTDLVANQADAFSAFVDYVQDRINAELKANPDFSFDNMEQLKKFMGAKLQKEFYLVQEKYFDKYTKANTNGQK